MKKLSTKEFITKANQIHNFKYDYSKTDYVNSRTKINIICKKHGSFLQNPNSHLQKCGCIKCYKNKLSSQNFIKKALQIHENKYNYSKTIYKNNYTKIVIICKKHGIFLQRPSDHLNGSGCKKCTNNILTTKEFITKANQIHNFKYDYSKTDYVNSRTKINIICKKHGEFYQQPRYHLNGHGCSFCSGRRIMTQDFIKKVNEIHNFKYDYSKTNYINAITKITIICLKHGEFKQQPKNHLNNHGCPKCVHTISKSETKWLNKLEKQNNIKIERNVTIFINKKRFRLDGFYKLSNTIYEYYGNFWHGNPKFYNPQKINPITKCTFGKLYQKTLEKENLLKLSGYNLITKWEN